MWGGRWAPLPVPAVTGHDVDMNTTGGPLIRSGSETDGAHGEAGLAPVAGRSGPSGRGRGSALVDTVRTLAPGIALSVVAAGLAYGLARVWPNVSPMLSAIVIGIIAANTGMLPGAAAPGISFAAKKLLRVGIVFLGLQLVLGDILALGAPMLAVIACIVSGGILGTLALGRALRVPIRLRLLVACGFSICGAAAVAGVAGVTDPDDEHEADTVTAVALVVIFGTLMIALVPLLATLLGMDSRTAGMWAGGSIHEIAQVVAVGGIIGGGALKVAVVVKLARVLLLAPVAALVSMRQRRIQAARLSRAEGTPGRAGSDGDGARVKMPPLVPLFVLAFLAMVLLRSFVPLPAGVLSVGKLVQTVLLASAMFGLGCGVKVRSLVKVGPTPFALAALATVLVSTIAFVGVTLVG